MSLLEWLGESVNPGSLGSSSVHINERRRSRMSCFFWGAITFAILAIPIIIYMNSSLYQSGQLLKWIGICAVAEFFYLLIGYHLKINPDYDNMGWCGGLIDNPFRYSDDWNRTMLFFMIFFMPARILAIGVIDFLKALFLKKTE
ncbi:MAG: hypothetical protein HRU15_03315 [Planctomycetes bacterium]|nr:hypothetical protein [Planctomycetota bacterium]